MQNLTIAPQSAQTDKPSMKMTLMGGKVECMEPNMVGVDDGVSIVPLTIVVYPPAWFCIKLVYSYSLPVQSVKICDAPINELM